jgi:hypothetical protein
LDLKQIELLISAKDFSGELKLKEMVVFGIELRALTNSSTQCDSLTRSFVLF